MEEIARHQIQALPAKTRPDNRAQVLLVVGFFGGIDGAEEDLPDRGRRVEELAFDERLGGGGGVV